MYTLLSHPDVQKLMHPGVLSDAAPRRLTHLGAFSYEYTKVRVPIGTIDSHSLIGLYDLDGTRLVVRLDDAVVFDENGCITGKRFEFDSSEQPRSALLRRVRPLAQVWIAGGQQAAA